MMHRIAWTILAVDVIGVALVLLFVWSPSGVR
jgi:hypothetical protein